MECPRCGSGEIRAIATNGKQPDKVTRQRRCVECRHVWYTVELPVSGWKKQSSNGTAYVSAVAQPPRDWVPPATAQSAAQSLAQATDGVVTEITEADLF